jgi:hypothetical protein
MANKISFVDVSLKHEPRKIGPGRKHRYAFFRKFMPHVMARRAASTYNISKGRYVGGELVKSRYYYPELMDALEELNRRIIVGMKLWHVDRDTAVKRMWDNLADDYKSRGIAIEDWQDVYRRWLNDTFEEDSP